MAGQPEARHIGHRVDGKSAAASAAGLFSAIICANRTLHRCLGDGAGAVRADQHAAADPLGQQDDVARLRARVAQHALRVHEPSHSQPVLRFLIDDRVPAGHRSAGFAHLRCAAAQDLRGHVRGQILREGRDVQREEHPAAHRVDVGHCVGRRDRAVFVGIVDDRREEIERLHQRALIIQRVDGRIVRRIEADEQLRKLLRRKLAAQAAQHLREAFRPVLGASTAAARQVREAQIALGHGSLPYRTGMHRAGMPTAYRRPALARLPSRTSGPITSGGLGARQCRAVLVAVPAETPRYTSPASGWSEVFAQLPATLASAVIRLLLG